MLSQKLAEEALIGARLTQISINKFSIVFHFDNTTTVACEEKITYRQRRTDPKTYHIQTQAGAPVMMENFELVVTSVCVSPDNLTIFLEDGNSIEIGIGTGLYESGHLTFGNIYAVF